MARTRGRIVAAAIELHGTVGPARTTMQAVAEGAGVTRATLYRHFRSDSELFVACSADWLAANPRPDATRWAAIADPVARLRVALGELYAYYRGTERMRANLLHDLDALPPPIRAGVASFPGVLVGVLTNGWPRRGARLRRAAIAHAIAFDTWRSLVGEGLADPEARDLMLRLVVDIEPRHGDAATATPSGT